MAEDREDVLAGDRDKADRLTSADQEEGRAETLGSSKPLRGDSASKKPNPDEEAGDASKPSGDEGRAARG